MIIRVTSLGPEGADGAGVASAAGLEPNPGFTGVAIALVASPPLDGAGAYPPAAPPKPPLAAGACEEGELSVSKVLVHDSPAGAGGGAGGTYALEGADGVLSSLLSSLVTLMFMPGSDGGPDGATPNPLPAPGTGCELKLAGSRTGSHGALCCGGAAAERERICVNDAGSDGAACGALGAPLPVPLKAPNICVSEGCGVLADGTGPPESARSRSSAGSFANSDVNPPADDEEGSAEAAGNGEAGADGNAGAAGGAIENDAVAVDTSASCAGCVAGVAGVGGVGSVGGVGGVTGDPAAAPPNALSDSVADCRYTPVADSGLKEGAGVLGVSAAAAVLKSAVNPPADGADAIGAAGGTDGAGGAAAAPPNDPKTCVNDPGCEAGCGADCAATGGNSCSSSRASGVTGALSGAETLPKSSVNPPEGAAAEPAPGAGVAAAGAAEDEAVAPPAPELACEDTDRV